MTQLTLALETDTQKDFPLTWPLVKASLIAKVHAVDAVDTVLRDRHTEGFSPYMTFSKSEFIAEVHAVDAVDAG